MDRWVGPKHFQRLVDEDGNYQGVIRELEEEHEEGVIYRLSVSSWPDGYRTYGFGIKRNDGSYGEALWLSEARELLTLTPADLRGSHY